MSDQRSEQDEPKAPPRDARQANQQSRDARQANQQPRDARQGTAHAHPAISAERGDDPASGSVDSPVAPGEAQAGDLSEQAANLGGPVDVFPTRGRTRTEREPG